MSFDLTARAAYLDSLSEISVNGHVTRKLDFLGTVHICGRHYFNVFRRYNNVHEIVIEDFNADYHFHKDYTIRQSLQRILCLSEEEMKGLYAYNVTSFKHNACPLTMKDAPNMRWSEVQALWQAAAIEFRGILEEYHALEDVKVQSPEVLSPELQSPEPHSVQLPQAPQAPKYKLPNLIIDESHEFHAPLSKGTNLIIDESHEFHAPLSKGTNLSDRFRAVEDKKRTWTQLSESESEYEEESDDESEEEYEESEESEEEEEDNSLFCMRLRSGTTLKK
jgi:hypothetical protein